MILLILHNADLREISFGSSCAPKNVFFCRIVPPAKLQVPLTERKTHTALCLNQGCAVDRALAQEIAISKGLIVNSGISKKLDFLVVADPYTQSGKAKKARELGIKILAEPVFWQMIGVEVE